MAVAAAAWTCLQGWKCGPCRSTAQAARWGINQATKGSNEPGPLWGATTAGPGVSLHGQPGEGHRGGLSCPGLALLAVQWGEGSGRQAQAM